MFDLILNSPIARLAFLLVLFASVFAITIYIAAANQRRSAARSAIRSIGGRSGKESVMGLRDLRESKWENLAERIEKAGLSLADTKVDTLRDKLRAAGYDSPHAPKVFTLVRLMLVIALPLGYFALGSLTNRQYSFMSLYLFGGGLALAGLYLPNLYVSARADRRREEIRNGFPDCLDLLLVCVEAGLGLEAAMDRVGREMVTSHPRVATLLLATTLRMRAGAQRDEALRKLGEQSATDEIRSFVTLLIQSDKLGTSIADTLRVYAAEMREKRRLRAEEKAHRLPVLMSIPLVVCMLPTMIGVLMLPGAVRMVREMLPALAGG